MCAICPGPLVRTSYTGQITPLITGSGQGKSVMTILNVSWQPNVCATNSLWPYQPLTTPDSSAVTNGFEAALTYFYGHALEFHGDLSLPEATYRSRLTVIVGKYAGDAGFGEGAARFVGSLHTDDLYLSLACAEGSDPAWQRFRTIYFRYLSDMYRYVDFAKSPPGELADSLLTDMFLPDRTGRSRIDSYQGRSSLQTWLRVVAGNRLINNRQKSSIQPRALEGLQEPRDLKATSHLESGLLRSRYGKVFMAAFREACQGLTGEERSLLLWRYEDNLRLCDIAAKVGIHQSNVTRHIEKLCGKLRSNTIAALQVNNSFSAAAIAECLLTAFDELDYSEGILASLRRPPGSEKAAHTSGLLRIQAECANSAAGSV